MKKRNLGESILFNLSRFISFFLVISAIVTITMLVFLRNMALDVALVRENALLTFLCIIFLTLFGCGFDAFRRYQTIDKPLARIISALDKIKQGDFSVRLNVSQKDINQAGFDEISVGINRLAQELSGVETLRTDFIASVSHELKTPLAAVKNYASLLRDPTLPADKRMEYVESIQHITQNLADLVSNILKMNKLENQQIYPEVRTFNLGEQLCECLLAFETAWEEKNLELDCHIPEDVLVEADPELMQLVWNNLLSNAIKFTNPNGKIGVSVSEENGYASVSISDTGCGMSPETGAHIFEKFYQGDTAHATQGNGLGLALVKRVVDILGAEISVSSVIGKGSAFTVRFRRTENRENSKRRDREQKG